MKTTSLSLLLLLGVSSLATAAFAQNDSPRRSRNDDAPPTPRAREGDRVRESDRDQRPPGPADKHRAHARPEDSRRGPQAGGPPPHFRDSDRGGRPPGPPSPGDRREQSRPEMNNRDRSFGPPPGGFRPPFATPQVCPHCGHALTPSRPDFRSPDPRRFTSENRGPAFNSNRRGPAFAPDRDRPTPPFRDFGPQRRGPDAPGRPPEHGNERLRNDRRDDRRDLHSDRQPPPPSRDDRDRKADKQRDQKNDKNKDRKDKKKHGQDDDQKDGNRRR